MFNHEYHRGKVLKFNGNKVFISVVNPDGTATIHFALGSGKKGFAGTLPALNSGKISNISEVEGISDITIDADNLDSVTLEAYNLAGEEEDLYGSVVDEPYDLEALPKNVVLDSEGVPISSSNRQAWIDFRQSGISASDMNKIVTPTGKVSGSWDSLITSKLTPKTDRMAGMYAHHGHEREPVIAAWVEENFGAKSNKFIFGNKDNPNFYATPDGLGDGFVVEIKTAKKSLEEMESQYNNQIQWQMHVMGYDRALFVVEQHKDLIPMGITYKWIERDDKLINELLVPNASEFIKKLHAAQGK